jgi:SSS family solute:Na+ symporter
MRKMMAFFNIPILAVVLLGVLSKRAQALSAYIAVPIGIAFYYWASFVKDGLLFGHQFHWLHVAGLNLVLIMSIMYLIRFIKPRKDAYVQVASGGIDITFWKGAKITGAIIVLLIIGMYWLLNYLF